MKKRTVSLCMIVKNEEEHLERCLLSVHDIVDEMIIVDTGSTDKTVDIAKKFGARILYYPWDASFSNARNFSLEHATGYWILLMDADDELVREDSDKLKKLIQTGNAEAYFFETHSFVGKKPGADIVVNLNIRLVRNRKEYRFVGRIHEQLGTVIKHVKPNAVIENKDIRIYHYGYLDSVIKKKKKRNRNIEILKELIKLDPDNTFTLFNMGNEYYALGEHRKALECYEKVYSSGNFSQGYTPKLFIRMATCYQDIGAYDKAIKIVEEGLQHFPDFTDLVFTLGSIYHQRGNFTLAIESFKKCLEMGEPPIKLKYLLGVGGYRAHFALGVIYMNLQHLSKACYHFTQCITQNPSFSPALRQLAFILLKNHPCNKVASILEGYLKMNTEEDYELLYSIFFNNGCFKKALEYLQARIRRFGSNPHIMFDRAKTFMMMGKFREAYEIFSSFPMENPKYLESVSEMIWCLWKMQQWTEAENTLYVLTRRHPRSKRIKVLNQLHRLLTGQKLVEVLSDDPEESQAYTDIIFEYLERFLQTVEFQQFENALGLLNLVEDKSVLYRLGKLYYRYGFSQMAKETLIRSIKELDYYNHECFQILSRIDLYT